MKTICIQIGNTDDKLKQIEWSHFVYEMINLVTSVASQVHFFGNPVNYAKWQNACWVFDVQDCDIDMLKTSVTEIAKKYKQDSTAWLQGTTEFI